MQQNGILLKTMSSGNLKEVNGIYWEVISPPVPENYA